MFFVLVFYLTVSVCACALFYSSFIRNIYVFLYIWNNTTTKLVLLPYVLCQRYHNPIHLQYVCVGVFVFVLCRFRVKVHVKVFINCCCRCCPCCWLPLIHTHTPHTATGSRTKQTWNFFFPLYTSAIQKQII